ncbi:carboxypeptidase regulatory-like domain-containing protein [Candidatus Poribacteria bacterium]|nr:carboxypeptidase regulatory-like domain-containing protein [Candidatus Poribacteria bacterium]
MMTRRAHSRPSREHRRRFRHPGSLALSWIIVACAAFGAAQIVSTAAAQGAAAAGVLKGRVLQPSSGKTFAGVSVKLETTSGTTAEPRETVTGEDGSFEFTGLPVDDTTAYTLSATVEGKTLKREGVALSTWTPEVVADLEMVDASGDPGHVHVDRITTILTPSEAPEIVPVIEFVEIHNDQDAPFAAKDEQGRTFGFRIELPAAAINIKVEGEAIPHLIEGTTVWLTDPLVPHDNFVSISYNVPKAESIDLSRKLHTKVEESLVLIGGGSWQPTTKGYEKQEPVDIHGAKYASFSRHSLEAGIVMPMTFKPGSGKAPGAGGDQTPILVIVLIGVFALLAGAALATWWAQRGRETSAPTKSARSGAAARPRTPAKAPASPVEDDNLAGLSNDELEALKQHHLESIARLDESFGKGEISERVHKQLREEQKAELSRIVARLDA